MANILINDGIHPAAVDMLTTAGHDVRTEHIPQDDLVSQLPSYDAICVRSATKVRQSLIDACPKLKVIGRGGVGLDNIDVDYARSKGIKVINTPAASSRSVAELVFAHLLSISRFVYMSNREMPSKGSVSFKQLKKTYSKGIELEGLTIGIVGFGRIGQETAKIALGLGMEVMGVDMNMDQVDIKIGPSSQQVAVTVKMSSMEDMLAHADVISLHVPAQEKPILGSEEFAAMKDGVMIVNASRGGTIDEKALIEAIHSGKVLRAGLDVFENEPNPQLDILEHPSISLTPHIGASTGAAQRKIGVELAQQLLDLLK